MSHLVTCFHRRSFQTTNEVEIIDRWRLNLSICSRWSDIQRSDGMVTIQRHSSASVALMSRYFWLQEWGASHFAVSGIFFFAWVKSRKSRLFLSSLYSLSCYPDWRQEVVWLPEALLRLVVSCWDPLWLDLCLHNIGSLDLTDKTTRLRLKRYVFEADCKRAIQSAYLSGDLRKPLRSCCTTLALVRK